MPASRKRFTGAVALAVVASGLLLVPSAPAQADVSTKISDFPYEQNWSNPGLITANDNWSGVTGVQGYLGQDLTTATGTNPQTLLASDSAAANDTDVIANNTTTGSLTASLNSGGVLEAEGLQSIALQGSGTADAPNVVFHFDLTGKEKATFSYDAKDLESGNDNATQQVAVHYRVGTSGPYTNLPDGYIGDATEVTTATLVTSREVALPTATDGAADVFVRVMTTNAAGNDEWVGIDNVSLTAEDQAEAPPLAATPTGDKTGIQGRAVTGFSLTASGGTPPYEWSATGLPAGVNVSTSGVVSGTPTEAGEFDVTATVTDAEDDTAIAQFTWIVADAIPTAEHVVISEVWGDGGFTGAPFKNSFVELYNPTDEAVSLAGSALAYLPSSNNGTIGTTQRTNLTGSIPAKGYYLISGVSLGSAGVALPSPDATTTINWHYQNGTIALLDTQDAVSLPGGDLAGVEHVVDAVGYGGSSAYVPVAYEGAPTGTNTGLTVSAVRSPVEADSDNNSVDFTTDSPTPTNAAGVSGGGSTVCDPSFPSTATIAQIQGTGSFAAGNNCTVTTEGVVTGVYRDVEWAGANSGYDGMYIQTGGTGGETDATPGASDAIFVFGDNATPAGVDIGDSVRVTGKVNEATGLTRITPASGGVAELGSALAPVTPLEIAHPATEAGREALEGMLLAPISEFVVTDAYSTNGSATVGLAASRGDVSGPLKQPTEYVAPGNAAGIQSIKDENASRLVVLDDGTNINYLQNQTTKAQPVPYLTGADGNANPAPPRVGARAILESPVLFDYRDGSWKFQPPSPVFLDGADVVTFEDTRADNLFPQEVGGDLTIATFNVLNYFNTTGEAYAASGASQNPPLDTRCTYYNDRQSNRIGNNSCGVQLLDDPDTQANEANGNDGRGPRGAATAISLARQEDKLANTINALDADVIGLEEVENSIKLPGETNRDDALARIVEILNEDAGEQKWAYVKSPGAALTAAAIAEQDVIRGAFIYQRETVQPVGQSEMLFGTAQFANAREPLAQAFKAKGAPDSDAFAVIVNHFKSKGDNTSPAPPATGDNANDSDTGVGAFNGDRVRQAERLVQFADDFAADREIDAVFLAGDFNSYSMEAPITRLQQGGYELVDSDDPRDESYSYQGLSGSLDHVLANEAAMAMVTGADIWQINAEESLAFQYSRYNYNVTDFWQPDLPFATSDHNPEIVGLDVPEFEDTTYREIQVIGTNDFHGRLLPDGGNAAGAAPFATAVEELKAEIPDSIFVAAGDLVGASTFESFVQDDEPTIDALNEMDLEVSAAGNHEFDRGYDDFLGRIQDRADWEYIAANVHGPEGGPQLTPTFTKTFGDVKVGFVGAVTEDLLSLVNPDLMDGVTVDDVVESVNDAAEDLTVDQEVDLVVLLVHEGSPSTECSSPSFTDPATTWGNIVQNTSSDVDAIVSGHTHLAYNCRLPVEDWADEGRDVTRRPVVSAGQYGTNLNKLVFKLDPETGELAAISQDIVATAGVGYAPDPEVKQIVDDAVAYADEVGNEVLGEMTGPFKRASYTSSAGATENRGGESTLGNQVAEVQRWATDADLALMNPGGLRADMLGTPDGGVRDLTYRQAADVQPFANTLVNMELTGAQIEEVLEQQWQRNAQGGVPSRPFLRLGVSEGFTYTYVESPETVTAPNSAPVNTFKGEVTGMWLDGEPIDPEDTYRVTVNSFLGTGGDNFWELANGNDKVDTGKVDLEAMVDYMEQYGEEPLEVDYRQRAVEVTFPNAAPAAYSEGDQLVFDVASWAMTASDDLKDAQIEVMLGDEQIGTAAVDNTVGNKPYDNYGTAQVSVTVPAVEDGRTVFTLVGATTGTEIKVPVRTTDGLTDTTVAGQDQSVGFGEGGSVPVTVEPATATGTVTLLDGAVELGQTTLTGGGGTIEFGPGLAPGVHVLALVYSGDGSHNDAEGAVQVTVGRAEATVEASPDPATVTVHTGTSAIDVEVSSDADPSGTVTASVGGTEVDTATLVDGKATLTVGPFASVGAKTVTIDYSGDSDAAPGSTTTTVTVVAAGTTVSATGGPVTRGTGWNAAVTVSPTTATGEVEVLDGTTSLGTANVSNGSASVPIAGDALPIGNHTLTVRYAGDDNHEESTNTFTVTVNPSAPATTPTSTTATVQPLTWGADGTVNVTVSPATSGSVTVSAGGTTIGTGTVTGGSGTVTIDGEALEPGTHSLTVRYAGNATHDASQATVSVTVAKAATSLDATTSAVDYGSAATISVSATPSTAEGAVTVSEGATTLGEGDLVGGADLVTLAAGLEPGTHTLTVAYAGDARHEAATTTVNLVVNKAASTTSATVTPGTLQVEGGRATVTVTVTAGDLDPTGTVTATIGGDQVDAAPLSDGQATLEVGPFAGTGTKKIVVGYSGDDRVQPSSTSASVQVVKADASVSVSQTPKRVKAKKTEVRLTVKVRAEGFTPGGWVAIQLGGQPNQRARLNDRGNVTFRLEAFATSGDKTVTVTYEGNNRTKEATTDH